MPRKDPITGCQVMTLPEFFQEEAKREGKESGELMSNMFDEIEQSYRQEEERFRNNPDELLNTLREEVKFYNEADPDAEQLPLPKVVQKILEVKVGGTFRTSTLEVKAECQKEDDSVGVLHFSSSSSAGSFYEPPDYESNVRWSND